MGIDKSTKPKWINVVLDSSPAYLKELGEQAKEDMQNEDGKVVKLSLTMDKHSFETDEYYYDERDNEITITGEMTSANGKSYVSICMPLSTDVLIDIIVGGLKKLNKLKTVMESLK